MLFGVIAIVLFLSLLVSLILFIVKGSLNLKQRMSITAISFFSVIGFMTTLIVFFSAISPHVFKVKLGHYVISHFSESSDMIGRLTVQEKDGELVVFPGNQEKKIVGLYKDGELWTAWLENGELTIEPNSATKLSLWNVFFVK